ncbi:MAG: hypothetical protein ACOY3K_02830 [Candidatus Omnitrophota bacterium]
MKRNIALLVLFSLLFSGCAVVMALKQPGKKNMQVLTAGIARENVVAHFGAPATTERENGERVDVYQFVQGFSGGAKATRALFHATADVFTLFIWEIIGTPTEAVWDGTKQTVKVTYDEEDRIKDVTFLNTTHN